MQSPSPPCEGDGAPCGATCRFNAARLAESRRASWRAVAASSPRRSSRGCGSGPRLRARGNSRPASSQRAPRTRLLVAVGRGPGAARERGVRNRARGRRIPSRRTTPHEASLARRGLKRNIFLSFEMSSRPPLIPAQAGMKIVHSRIRTSSRPFAKAKEPGSLKCNSQSGPGSRVARPGRRSVLQLHAGSPACAARAGVCGRAPE